LRVKSARLLRCTVSIGIYGVRRLSSVMLGCGSLALVAQGLDGFRSHEDSSLDISLSHFSSVLVLHGCRYVHSHGLTPFVVTGQLFEVLGVGLSSWIISNV